MDLPRSILAPPHVATRQSTGFARSQLSPLDLRGESVQVTGRIVVIGGSSGALESLLPLVRGLPPNFGAAVFVVFHMPASAPGRLDRVLKRMGSLPVHYAVDGESIRPGEIYLARPDRHLILKRDRVCVTHGPKENRFRPAIDPLFRTAAIEHGPR